jgi:tripartite-type tricarboxylate transporter receptor subunit TctC
VPAATPKPIVEKLTAALSKVLTSPDVISKLTSQGNEIFLLPGKEFSDYLQEDSARLTKLITSANIKGD